jgi:hypothetical protein
VDWKVHAPGRLEACPTFGGARGARRPYLSAIVPPTGLWPDSASLRRVIPINGIGTSTMRRGTFLVEAVARVFYVV